MNYSTREDWYLNESVRIFDRSLEDLLDLEKSSNFNLNLRKIPSTEVFYFLQGKPCISYIKNEDTFISFKRLIDLSEPNLTISTSTENYKWTGDGCLLIISNFNFIAVSKVLG